MLLVFLKAAVIALFWHWRSKIFLRVAHFMISNRFLKLSIIKYYIVVYTIYSSFEKDLEEREGEMKYI